jgi:hypothetical protein
MIQKKTTSINQSINLFCLKMQKFNSFFVFFFEKEKKYQDEEHSLTIVPSVANSLFFFLKRRQTIIKLNVLKTSKKEKEKD